MSKADGPGWAAGAGAFHKLATVQGRQGCTPEGRAPG